MKKIFILALSVFLVSCGQTAKKENKVIRPFSVAKVITKDTIVMLGDSFHAKIYLANYPKKQLLFITIDSINGHYTGSFRLPTEDSIGFFNYLPDKEGINRFCGIVSVKEVDSIRFPHHKYMRRGYYFRSIFKVKNPGPK
jgi:hypothetical protein